MGVNTAEISAAVESHSHHVQKLIEQVSSVVVGQRHMIERLVIGMLTGGHVLLEGVPGLAKTLTVSSLAGAINATFSRVQFTPDLLPADLIGTLIYRPSDGAFTVRKGPIFANIVLADEINRAPAKVQSALLEAMQEKQATIGDTTHTLPSPFLVLATQNPIEQEGTYPLPEAQVDRFMLKVHVDYPEASEERVILDRMATSAPQTSVSPVVQTEEILASRKVVDSIYVDDAVKDYVVRLVQATRRPEEELGAKAGNLARLIEFGASPRATINLVLAARAQAFLEGRGYVTPADIKAVGMDVLRHRVLPSYEAQAEDVSAEQIVDEIFSRVHTP